jgi:hypothetical protein
MEGITKEYFDEHMSALTMHVNALKETMASKDDLKNLATKNDLHEAVAELAGIIERTINVSGRVEQLEQDMTAAKEALHI